MVRSKLILCKECTFLQFFSNKSKREDDWNKKNKIALGCLMTSENSSSSSSNDNDDDDDDDDDDIFGLNFVCEKRLSVAVIVKWIRSRGAAQFQSSLVLVDSIIAS